MYYNNLEDKRSCVVDLEQTPVLREDVLGLSELETCLSIDSWIDHVVSWELDGLDGDNVALALDSE